MAMAQSMGRPRRDETMKSFTAKLYRCFVLAPMLLFAGCGSPEQRAQGYYERGVALIEKKDDLAARLELLNAVKFKSDKIEAWRALAGINERTKAYQPLFENLRRIVELDPTDIDARLKLGEMLLAGNAPDAALRIVEGAGEPGDQNPGLHALKAAILVKMRDVAGGLDEAQKATGLDPGNVDAAVMLASDKLSKGDVDSALQIISAPPVVSKSYPRIEQIRAQIFVRKGDLAQAEGILHKLIDQKPQEIALRDQLVRIYVAQRRFDEAERELRSIAAANPGNTGAELDLVRFLSGIKGPAVAREELVSRITGGGDVFAYQMTLADLDFGQGKVDESTALLEGLITAPGAPEHALAAQTKLAEFHFRKANYPAAEKLVGDILKKDPRNTTGLKIRASIRIEQGQFESAISDLREALNAQPKSPELLLLMAIAYEREGKLELADRQYADATKSAAGNPNVSRRYVAFLQRQGRVAQAEDVLTASVAANPRSIDLLSALAQIRLARQNWTGALTVADSIQAIGNDRGIANLIRGSAFAGQNKMDQAIAALEAAHASAPDALQGVVSLVTAYIRSGKAGKAETLLDDMAKKYPENVQLSLLMGSTQLAKNNIAEAEKNFKRAIEQNPKEEAGYIALSNFYIRQKDYAQAIKILQDGGRELPDSLNLKLTLAVNLFQTGNYEEAIEKYESILKDAPDTPLAINNLASLLLDYRSDKDSINRAYALAEKLKNSNVAQFQDTVGWAQYNQGDFKAAVAKLESAQAQMPNLAAIRYHLGMSYIATGQTEKAAEQLKAALQLEPDGSALKDKIRSALK
jgi:tetratricopeptide (TPR) repeat protein